MQLTPEMLLIVGIVASILTQILKLLADKVGVKVSGAWSIVLLFVVAIGLAAGFFYADFLADPVGSIAGLIGVAVTIYHLLFEKVVFPAVRLA